MLESLHEQLRTQLSALGSTLRIADGLDILVVSVIVYATISWFRQSRSRLVMSGLITLALLYFAAGLLEMRLTLALFQAGITIAAVALVVIFQEEIRRAFERVALAGRFGANRSHDASEPGIQVVVEAAATLAKNRTGALIVFRGRESLERHLTGGVALNGSPSEALLDSIFDASSAGHDGALIIEDGLVTRFGAHLPLSVEIKGNERFGTRHTAALGLSERCDALIVVVSEERGVISIAQNGKLTVVSSSSELQKALLAFKERIRPGKKASSFGLRMRRGIGLKLLSLAIAIGAWIVTFGYRTDSAVRSLSAPLVFKHLPPGWVVKDSQPLEVTLLVSGPQRDVEALDTGDVSVAMDVSTIRSGTQSHKLSSSDVKLPPGMVVREIEPDEVRFSAERTVTVEATVDVKTRGKLPAGYALGRISATPSRVTLVVPRSRQKTTRRISTAPVELDAIKTSGALTVPLTLPSGVTVPPDGRTSVTVRIEVRPPL